MPHHPLWVAHRGASREHRENTLEAFRRAVELGADAIELDVHTTRDGAVVVHHDFDVAAPEGPMAIATAPLATIRAIDLGGGARVPTLDEVFDAVGGGAELLVELKGRGIAATVVEGLLRHRDAYAVHSFDHLAIERVAARWPAVRRGLLFDEAPSDLQGSVARTGAHDFWPRGDLATSALVSEAHALGLRVIAWTVNDPSHARELTARGVDGLCTDDVRWLGQA